MSKPRKVIPFLVGSLVIVGLLGCGLMPEALQGMTASVTPTGASMPIPTSTSTLTPEPTATATVTVEKSPLEIAPCLDDADCPEAVGPIAFLPDGIFPDEVNEFQMPYDQTLLLDCGWLAKDQLHLDQNLQHIVWVFTIDDQDFFTDEMLVNREIEDQQNPGTTNPGKWLSVTLSGWKMDEPHYIRYGFYLDDAIDDGWNTTDADYSSITTLLVKPANIPAITPGPTLTNTPLPQPEVTKAAVLPTATSSAPLTLDMTLKVTNLCSDTHVVIVTGPMRLKYTVAPGQTVEYQAAQGTYTWMIDKLYPGGPQDLFQSVWTLTLCQ